MWKVISFMWNLFNHLSEVRFQRREKNQLQQLLEKDCECSAFMAQPTLCFRIHPTLLLTDSGMVTALYTVMPHFILGALLQNLKQDGRTHRIIDYRIEKSMKGRQLQHNLPGLAPLHLDSTPTQSGCWTGPAAPTDHLPFVSISRLLRHSLLRHHTFLFCHL